MSTMQVSTKGQVVIPRKLRHKHGITPGTRVIVTEHGGHIAIFPLPKDPVAGSRGMLNLGKPTAELIREIRAEEKALEKRQLRRLGKGGRGR